MSSLKDLVIVVSRIVYFCLAQDQTRELRKNNYFQSAGRNVQNNRITKNEGLDGRMLFIVFGIF